jgi:hypothetical protein
MVVEADVTKKMRHGKRVHHHHHHHKQRDGVELRIPTMMLTMITHLHVCIIIVGLCVARTSRLSRYARARHTHPAAGREGAGI